MLRCTLGTRLAVRLISACKHTLPCIWDGAAIG